MTELFRLILACLAAYRLALLFTLEDGPFDVFVWMRERAGAYDYDENGNIPSNLGRGAVCPLCAGVWCAGLCAWLYYRQTNAGDLILLWMGIAGAQAFLYRFLDR